VILSRSPATDVTRLMEIRPPNTPLFALPVASADAFMRLFAEAWAYLTLHGTQSELFRLLNSQQRSKFLEDSAKSAFTYEDFRSNQLGIRFFYQYGVDINSNSEASRESLFTSALASFFSSINVENNDMEVDRLAQGLPLKEQFSAGKTTEQEERRRHPELFRLP
jgi:hypothetical protein